MTKIKPNTKNVTTAEQIFDGLIYNSPYRKVALRYFKLKNISPDIDGKFNIVDLLEAYHEFAKVDHKINKKEKAKG